MRAASLYVFLRIYAGCPPAQAMRTALRRRLRDVKWESSARVPRAFELTRPGERTDYSYVYVKLYTSNTPPARTRTRGGGPPRARTCVVCAKVSQSITIDSPRAACVASVLAIANRRENSEAARGSPCSQPRYRLLQITFTTSHDPPRDTLNDEGTLLFFCLSHRSTKRLFLFYFVLVHDAESTHVHTDVAAEARSRGPASCCAM